MGRWSNLALGHPRATRPGAIRLWFVGHSMERARQRLHLSPAQAHRDCARAIVSTLARGRLPDSGDRSGHKLARGRLGIWAVSPCPLGGWQVHSVVPRRDLTLRRGTGRWWIVRRPPAQTGRA